MNALVGFVVEHGVVLLTGTTVILALGAVVMTCQRSPVHRQRVGELTVAAWLAWLVLTCVPLPRVSLDAAPTQIPGTETEAPTVVSEPIGVAEPAPPSELLTRPVLEEQLSQPERSVSVAGVIESGSLTVAPLAIDVAPRTARFEWPRVIGGAYVAGVVVATLWIVLGHILLRRLIGSAQEPEEWLAQIVGQLCPLRNARLLVSERVSRPMSCGIFRPVVVLPSECVERGLEGQLVQVLRHELAHVAQRDAVGHALFNLVLPLLYFHPLYWLVRRGTFLARELVADDRAAADAGSKESYVRELIALAARRLGAGPASGRLNVIGIFESTTHFYRRMHMLLQRQTPLATGCSKWWGFTAATTASLILAASSLFVGVDRAHAQANDARDEEVARLRSERDELRREVEQLRGLVKEMNQVLDGMRKEAANSSSALARLMEDQKLAQMKRDQRAAAEGEMLSRGADAAGAAVDQGTRLPRHQAEEQAALQPSQHPRHGTEMVSHKVQLDLIALANACIEAEGNRKLQRVEFDRIKKLGGENIVSQSELLRAEVGLEMAERKARLFRAMAEASLRGAEAELKHVKDLAAKGFMSTGDVQQAESKLLVLKLIVSN
jgi:hypothetical protein